MPLPRRLLFSRDIHPLHAVTYLLGVSLFSISFLVFLNAALSFVLTDLLHKRSHLGDIVGTLGFVDELVAIVAAPFWGAVSDGRLGTRGVVVLCYWIIAGSLVLFVNVPTVYPGLLLARMVFSVGAAGVATMVSAILPEMTAAEDTPAPRRIVITPPTESLRAPIVREAGTPPAQSSGKLAGLVGLFTGFGALLALSVFLRLPTRFAQYGPEEAVRRAFYTVAGTAAGVGIWCFLGLPGRGKEAGHRSFRRHMYDARVWIWTKIWGGSPEALPSLSSPPSSSASTSPTPSTRAPRTALRPGGLKSLKTAFKAGLTDSRLSLSYLAGFVARATSVGISLFIPLFVNAYFIRHGLCPPSTPSSPTPKTCRQAYILAAKLTGTTQLAALLLAPVFGYWTDHAATNGGRNTPLVVSALLGVIGFTGFGMLTSPEPRENPMVWVYAVLMGAAQIGGIVCSLGLLARAVSTSHSEEDEQEGEQAPLLSGSGTPRARDRRHVKGGIAGVYSLSGGVGILVLTKLGGWGFDGIASGWPFWLLAGFEGVLVLAGVLEGVFGVEVRRGR
ncbi:MFS general substrate transporter [Choiromyces venosus 120613-1]|uniref:MFS general substrate transporter n=1 Tax=Choiromyces venosus 120613-1 TaxID=1336337 RepID=A0A3N4JVS8_9PEZI|nr:MFS general substrate transporter [Choiromyces venosus 120613-1]